VGGLLPIFTDLGGKGYKKKKWIRSGGILPLCTFERGQASGGRIPPLRKSWAEGFEQPPDFVVNLRRIGHRLGDFPAQKFAITFAQAMGSHLDRPFRHVELGGDFGMGDIRLTREIDLEAIEKHLFVVGDVFRAQGRKHLVEKGEGPLAFEESFRRPGVAGFAGIARIAGAEIQGQGNDAAAVFLGTGFIPFVGEEIFESGEEKTAKSATFLLSGSQNVFFKKAGEEFLG